MIGIINKTSKDDKSLQTTKLIASERDVIIIIINLGKYPDMFIHFPSLWTNLLHINQKKKKKKKNRLQIKYRTLSQDLCISNPAVLLTFL